MRIHYLQHVPYEGLGNISLWIEERGHALTCTRMFDGENLPHPSAFDFLVVMGGPMGVHDEQVHPWLIPEKAFIKTAIGAGRIVLGICLGAQLIADALGGSVTANPHREIGWFPVRRDPELVTSNRRFPLPDEFLPFHWHADTFTIPDGAIRLASSEACDNQGFLYGDRVLGLQFHPETTRMDVREMVAHSMPVAATPPWQQTAEEMLAEQLRFTAIIPLMHAMLDHLAAARV